MDRVLDVVRWSCLWWRSGQVKDGDCKEVAVVPLRQKWRSQIVSTGIWALADAEWGKDVGISDVGRRPTFDAHL